MNVRHPGCLTLISYQKDKCGDILSSSPTLMMMMMIMMMDYPLFLWHRWPTKGVSSQDYCWSFSPSQISNTSQASKRHKPPTSPEQELNLRRTLDQALYFALWSCTLLKNEIGKHNLYKINEVIFTLNGTKVVIYPPKILRNTILGKKGLLIDWTFRMDQSTRINDKNNQLKHF